VVSPETLLGRTLSVLRFRGMLGLSRNVSTSGFRG